MKLTIAQLKQRQSLSLDQKIRFTKRRIKEFYEFNEGNVTVSFSGGKDSTVLLHLVRSIYPDVKGVFVNTGLEYPEVVEFVNTIPNIDIIYPKKSFIQVIRDHGYPVISKRISRFVNDVMNPNKRNANTIKLRMTGIAKDGRKLEKFMISKKWKYLIKAPFKISEKCCYHLKHEPLLKYEKINKTKPFIGTMANEGMMRESQYLINGCNMYKAGRSMPLSIWMEEDIWGYIRKFNIPYSRIYDMGEDRTGCIFCMFGIMNDGIPNRFQRMSLTHPKLYNVCMNKLGIRDVLKFLRIPYLPVRKVSDWMK